MKKLVLMLLIMLGSGIMMSAQTVSKEYENEVERYLQLSNTKEMTIQTVEQAWQQNNLPITDYHAAAVAVFDNLWPKITKDVAVVYSKYITLDDLKQINAFYETPEGKKLVEAGPQMSNDIMQLMVNKYAGDMQQILKKYIKM